MEKKAPADLLVISSYPEKGFIHGSSTVGIASYTKNTLLALQKVASEENTPLSITIFAEKLKNVKKNELEYSEDSMKVQRIWKRDSLTVFIPLIKALVKNPAENVLIEFELSMFGGVISLLQFPFFLALLKLKNKTITIVLHQVIEDIGSLSAHVNLPIKSFRTTLINYCIKYFYTLLLSIVDKVIVFEEDLKEKLSKYTTKNNIVVIPHGVESFLSKYSKKYAKEKLNITSEFTILCFGYLAWYKGSDWIIKEFLKLPNKNNPMELIMAGGPNPNHLSKPFYTTYIQSLKDMASASPFIQITDFVPEESIALYYLAADIVVLPYRTFMSSSGPLSIALSFNKPFLFSENLKAILKTSDFKESIEKLNINPKDLCFSLEDDSFIEKTQKYRENKEALLKLENVSKKLHSARQFESIAKRYFTELSI
jgi:glycosyltransferase involved in cell wall biosynthesis